MDACDEVMLKVDKPEGLIRISSYNNIVEGKKSIFTIRVLAYILVLTALIATVTTLMLRRSDIDATVLRIPGQLYQKTEDGKIQNLFNVLFVNKTFAPASVEIRLKDNPGGEIIIVGGAEIDLKPNSTKELVLFVSLPLEVLEGAKTPIVFEIIRDGEIIETSYTNFLGPFSF
jgi:polyferredoxin